MKFKAVKEYIKSEIKFLDNRLKYFQKEYDKTNKRRNDIMNSKAELEHQIRVLQSAIKILEKKVRE